MKHLSESERFAYTWRETIYQAMRDLVLTDEASAADRQAAHDWVFSASIKPGAFIWACVVTGLDPETVRGELRARGIG